MEFDTEFFKSLSPTSLYMDDNFTTGSSSMMQDEQHEEEQPLTPFSALFTSPTSPTFHEEVLFDQKDSTQNSIVRKDSTFDVDLFFKDVAVDPEQKLATGKMPYGSIDNEQIEFEQLLPPSLRYQQSQQERQGVMILQQQVAIQEQDQKSFWKELGVNIGNLPPSSPSTTTTTTTTSRTLKEKAPKKHAAKKLLPRPSEIQIPIPTNTRNSYDKHEKINGKTANDHFDLLGPQLCQTEFVEAVFQNAKNGTSVKNVDDKKVSAFTHCVHMVPKKDLTTRMNVIYLKLKGKITNAEFRARFEWTSSNTLVEFDFHPIKESKQTASELNSQYVKCSFRYLTKEVVTPGNYLEFELFDKIENKTACKGCVRFYNCALTQCQAKCTDRAVDKCNTKK